MGGLAILFLACMLAVAALVLFGRIGDLQLPNLREIVYARRIWSSAQRTPELFHCRVRLSRQDCDNSAIENFVVEISGQICAPRDLSQAVLQVSISDVTGVISAAKPVHSSIDRWRTKDSPTFRYRADLGKIPYDGTVLRDWVEVAQLNTDWLIFPHKGRRSLRFHTSILSGQKAEELASAACPFSYENNELGYIDSEENGKRVKMLAVPLALAVSAADGNVNDSKVDVVRSWARDNIYVSHSSKWVRWILHKAFEQAIRQCRTGSRIDVPGICREVVHRASPADRYDIMELCLHVVHAHGVASSQELTLLKNLASWLEIDAGRFRSMMDKTLPASMHEIQDLEIILGISPDMSEQQARQRLNEEYRKWNARVTNPDSKVRAQAADMLRLIGQARLMYQI